MPTMSRSGQLTFHQNNIATIILQKETSGTGAHILKVGSLGGLEHPSFKLIVVEFVFQLTQAV